MPTEPHSDPQRPTGPDLRQVFGDLWKFQERLRRWSRVSESVEARPTARFDHAAAYDAQRRTWWLHGGGNGVEGPECGSWNASRDGRNG